MSDLETGTSESTLDNMIIDCEDAVVNILEYNRRTDGTVIDANKITDEQREELIEAFANKMRTYNKNGFGL